jgi:uncharacterized protein (DUF433 family)
VERATQGVVVSDPEILDGAPVLRGTRVPVHDVAASVAAGIPLDRILAAYPSLDADTIAIATTYAEAYSVDGLTRSGAELANGTVIIADRRVPRRGTAG